MSRVLILSVTEDTKRVRQLGHALQGCGFSVGFADEATLAEQRLSEWDCLLLCWSASAETLMLNECRLVKKAARKDKLLPALLTLAAPPVGTYPVDLSRWRGGSAGPILAVLTERIKQKIADARRHRTRLRVFRGTGAVLIIFGVLEFAVSILEAPSKLCSAGYAPGICSWAGLGGVPTTAQEQEYQRALVTGCEGLRRFISSSESNPRRSDAQAKYDARTIERIETWKPEVRELALHVRSHAARRADAQTALTRNARGRAERLCRGFEAGGATRFVSARVDLGLRSCEIFSDGWRCSAEGVARCSIRRRNVATRVVCQ